MRPWNDDIALSGPDAPENDGTIEFMIQYLLTVRKRFGNTCVSVADGTIKWGGSSLHYQDKQNKEVQRLLLALEKIERVIGIMPFSDAERTVAQIAQEARKPRPLL